MERPNSGILCIKLKDQVPVPWQQLDIPTLRVLWIDNGAVPTPNSDTEDLHILTMEMHRMRNRELIVDDESNGLVLSCDV